MLQLKKLHIFLFVSIATMINNLYIYRLHCNTEIGNPRCRGFTLIEIVVTLVILGIVAVMGGAILANAARSYDIARNNAHLVQKAQVAMTRITSELSRVHDTEGFNCSNNRIDYKFCNEEEERRIIKNGKELLYQIIGNGDYILADNVEEFNINGDNNTCEIKLTMEGLESYSFLTRITPITVKCPDP